MRRDGARRPAPGRIAGALQHLRRHVLQHGRHGRSFEYAHARVPWERGRYWSRLPPLTQSTALPRPQPRPRPVAAASRPAPVPPRPRAASSHGRPVPPAGCDAA
eukprot:scaffold24040_cov67-Phaeocystis_antarctica.AAC.1